MAITNNFAKFLFYVTKLGVSYHDTLMLGRLNVIASKDNIQEFIKIFSNNDLGVNGTDFKGGYAEPLFKILGAETVNSLDFSDYEQASIIHDLNIPITNNLKERFTAIIDGGTIEHVFNFPVAIKNCMEVIKINGHFIAVTPVNNQMGHGFYQFSPELFYRVFSSENGFQILKMIICIHPDEQSLVKWYEVADPKALKERVMLVNKFPTSIMFVAQKTHQAEIFQSSPQQSDYSTTWVARESAKMGIKPTGVNNVKYLYKRIFPKRIRIFLSNLFQLFSNQRAEVDDLGYVDPNHFKEIKL